LKKHKNDKCPYCGDSGTVLEDSGGQTPWGEWINIPVPCRCKETNMSKENDVRIKELMALVEKKEKDLGQRPRFLLETNGLFKLQVGGGEETFNINTVKDPVLLVNALAMLITTENARREAAQRLGVEISEHRFRNYTIKDWETDFRNRVKMIEYERKKEELELIKKKLETLVSAEGRTKDQLDKICKLLGI
jgi:hypothetical protein